MNEFEYTVAVEYKDGTEEELDIAIDLDDFAEGGFNSGKIDYVKNLAKRKSKD